MFGNVKKYITMELVREMYLEYIRVNKDPVQYEFRWGERAYQEVKKKDLLEFACSVSFLIFLLLKFPNPELF